MVRTPERRTAHKDRGICVDFDPERIDAFLRLLPHVTQAAALLGRRHDHRLKAPAWLKVDAAQRMRHAFEIRHERFRTRKFIDLLRHRDVALVCADRVEWPRLMHLTSDCVYCRLHGSEELYASGYDDKALDEWARRVAAWARGGEPDDAERVGPKARKRRRDVLVYFNNDIQVRVPADARDLLERVAVLLSRSRVRPIRAPCW